MKRILSLIICVAIVVCVMSAAMVSTCAMTTISVGEILDIDITLYERLSFYFIPDHDGYYMFESYTNGDPCCELYDAADCCLDVNDDADEYAYDFRLTEFLYAGETYCFDVMSADGRSVYGSACLYEVESDGSDDDPDNNTVYEEGDYTYTVTDNQTAAIVDYFGEDEDITIPEKIGGLKVTAIADYALSSNPAFVNVTLPQTVETIGCSAFFEAGRMKTLTVLNPDCVFDESLYYSFYSLASFETLYGYSGSTAEQFVQYYNDNYGYDEYTRIKFVALDAKPPVDSDRELGDVDGDGDISVIDATAIQLHIASLKTIDNAGLGVADTDKDGDISILDATQIQMFIALLIPQL